ncbi:MAG: aldo/keto reductase [Acidimicrobiia bacterium]|nr:aldo/keto reductase [Acidimicrobiia bacterium]
MSISRRSFLESAAFASLTAQTAALAAEADKKTGMPTRILGKTGARVSIVGMGCGSRLLSYKDEDKAIEALHRAMDLGVTYLDTAYGYGSGKSETWVANAIKGRRKGLWVTTKINERNPAKASKILEESMKRLQLDQVDLIHVHSLLGPEDLAEVEAKGGVLDILYKLREQKVTRFIGFTSHTDPKTLAAALERHDVDCTQMALNVALVGMVNGQGGMVMNKELTDSFERIALPVALKKKMGVTAMKTFAQDGLIGAAPIETLMRYSLTLPVAATVLGMPKLSHIDENIAAAKAFKPLSKSEMRDLSDKMSRQHKARLDRYFRDHVDA